MLTLCILTGLWATDTISTPLFAAGLVGVCIGLALV